MSGIFHLAIWHEISGHPTLVWVTTSADARFRRVAKRTMSVSELHLPREFAGAHSFGAIHGVHCTLHLRCIPHREERGNAT
jgi:hypothetical protein